MENRPENADIQAKTGRLTEKFDCAEVYTTTVANLRIFDSFQFQRRVYISVHGDSRGRWPQNFTERFDLKTDLLKYSGNISDRLRF